MEITPTEHRNDTFNYGSIYPEEFKTLLDTEERIYRQNTDTYEFLLKETWFEGICIGTYDIELATKEKVRSTLAKDTICFFFCLEGCFTCLDSTSASLFVLTKNQQHVFFNSNEEIAFSLNQSSSFVCVQLTKKYYFKLTNSTFNSLNAAYTEKIISTEIARTLLYLINHEYTGRAKRLFLESKIFELIIFYINRDRDRPLLTLSSSDVKKILNAKDLVERDLQNPNSLIELARKVGINDYKLKKGFKELTGDTVFGYLYKLRMERAYHLLTREKKTVNDASFLVGYKNPQHFITAFKKRYNILPGALSKR